MIVYLAGEAYGAEVFREFNYCFNRLDSFFYVRKNKGFAEKIKNYNRYLLDSGAFTFIMTKKKIKIDIDYFTDQYIDFIKEHKVQHFFEMDVDSVYGYEKVKGLRKKIESKTGKQSIPVFHKNRGFADWVSMCKDYKYISIGIAGKDVSWGDYKTFNKFVLSAMEHETKVHGLGITGMESLKRIPFYSVDSSAWTAGNRYKTIYNFDGNCVKSVKTDLSKKRISNHLGLAKHNFGEWVKFSKSMENKIVI
jgi:hypothetical protein